MYIQAMNVTEEDHLQEVLEAMREMGAPEIRVYDDGEMYIALEGSYRLAAAWELGLEPIIIEMDEDEEMEHDIDTCEEINTVADMVEYLGGAIFNTGATYNLDEFDIEYR